MTTRPGYCPIGGEPCQSLCEVPCRSGNLLTDAQISSACRSFRRDFHKLDGPNKAQLMDDARRWERAFAIETARGITKEQA